MVTHASITPACDMGCSFALGVPHQAHLLGAPERAFTWGRERRAGKAVAAVIGRHRDATKTREIKLRSVAPEWSQRLRWTQWADTTSDLVSGFWFLVSSRCLGLSVFRLGLLFLGRLRLWAGLSGLFSGLCRRRFGRCGWFPLLAPAPGEWSWQFCPRTWEKGPGNDATRHCGPHRGPHRM